MIRVESPVHTKEAVTPHPILVDSKEIEALPAVLQPLHGDDASHLLHQIFQFIRKEGHIAKEREKVVQRIEGRIARLEHTAPLTGAQVAYGFSAFGVTCARELAELFIEEFERMRIRPKTFNEFLARTRTEGYRGRVRGRLFHLFVRNFEPLQRDFLENSIAQVKELNEPEVRGYPEPIAPPAPKLVTAKGEELQGKVVFAPPRKAERIRILKKNGRAVEFIDDAYVSSATASDAMLWSFLCEIEVKTAAAANGFGKQIGFSQIRVEQDDVSELEMIVAGYSSPVKVRPEHIIFSQRSIERNAVTLFSNKAWFRMSDEVRSILAIACKNGDAEEIFRLSDFRFQATAKGYGDTFRRITLAIHTGFLDTYVQAIWPASPDVRLKTGASHGNTKPQ